MRNFKLINTLFILSREKWIFLISLIFSIEAYSICNWTTQVNNGELIFDEYLQPSPALIELLSSYHIHTIDYRKIVQETQKKWLRPSNLERWQLDKKERPEYLPIFRRLGLIEECLPTRKNYDYAVILGGKISTMKSRIAFFKKLIKRGLNVSKVVMLTGNRKLDEEIEIIDVRLKNKRVTTEADAARALIESMILNDNSMSIEKIVIIDSRGKDGKRPTTADTVKEWINLKPKRGSILAISSQPFIGTQSAILQYELPSGFKVEAVGLQADSHLPHSIYMDNLARWIYQLVELKQHRIDKLKNDLLFKFK